MWSKAGAVRVVDIEQVFFIVEFLSESDYEEALTGGPWVASDSYLVVKRWKPNFNMSKEVISKITVWIRLPLILMDYFDRKILFNMGSEVGRILKIDELMARRKRGRFVRICVKIDLTKPLLPQYVIDGVTYPIEYERMNLLCLKCGTFVHVKEAYHLNERQTRLVDGVEEVGEKERAVNINPRKFI